MKSYLTGIILLVFFLFCQSNAYAVKLVKCGTEWINLHKGNPDLIGVYVQQLPDDIKDAEDYVGKHPVAVMYLFNGNRAHTLTYTPTGQVQNGVWHDISKDHWAWKFLVKDQKNDIECAYWK
ncbi:MAG: hypothetical protein D3910_12405 [Candidatus Electrothrix sp. ATG2]|nr:hypothetical protein [Candidatus Electrothrix sp. ATG2]